MQAISLNARKNYDINRFLLFPDDAGISTKHDRKESWSRRCVIVISRTRWYAKLSSLLRYEICSQRWVDFYLTNLMLHFVNEHAQT